MKVFCLTFFMYFSNIYVMIFYKNLDFAFKSKQQKIKYLMKNVKKVLTKIKNNIIMNPK